MQRKQEHMQTLSPPRAQLAGLELIQATKDRAKEKGHADAAARPAPG
jgi:hypothetical protein